MFTQELSNVQYLVEKKTELEVEKFFTDMKSNYVLSQYESLRAQVLNRSDLFAEHSLGVALFIRRGMLAWLELYHRCIPVTPNREKRVEQPVFAHKTTSEMIKVMANITLFNLEEALL